MSRGIVILSFLLLSSPLWSLTQRGIVRTIARQDKSSVPVANAVIRVRGQHNAVMSQKDGTFSIELTDKHNGDPFVLSSVILSGYEVAEKEMLGRPIACSEQVVLEILMVSREDLQKEKDAIAEKARQNVEVYYEQRVSALEKQLSDGQIAQAEYQQQLDMLEQKYEQFEPLLELMADRFARTDYNSMDTLDLQINDAIQQGNLDLAEQLIHSKGDFASRERSIMQQDRQNEEARQTVEAAMARLKAAEDESQRQRDELAKDYYNLYSISLSRFQNDSAVYWICRCADIDTLKTDYQIEAGRLAIRLRTQTAVGSNEQMAIRYFTRALRQADLQYGEMSLQSAIATHELGRAYRRSGDIEKAEDYFTRSLNIRQQTRAAQYPEEVAETQNELAEVYYYKNDLKKALALNQQALKLRQQKYGNHSLVVAESLNNIGSIYFKQQRFKQAQEQFEQVRQIYSTSPKVKKQELAVNLSNLAGVCFYNKDYDLSIDYFSQAYDIYKVVLGEENHLTIQMKESIDLVRKIKEQAINQ